MQKIDKGESGVLVHATATVAVHESTVLGMPATVLHYGDELLVTARHVEASRDANGRVTLWDLVDRPGAPLHSGPWDPTVSRTEPGSPRWDEERVAALRAAALISDPDEQRIAAAKVREKYGSAPEAKSRTLSQQVR